MTSQLEQTSFLFGANERFVEELYDLYIKDPGSIDPSWAKFFQELGDDGAAVTADLHGPSWAPRSTSVIGNGADLEAAAAAVPVNGGDAESVRQATLDSIRALMLIRSYRVRGHLIADLDPLGLEARDYHPELDPKTYGFTDADMDRPIFINHVLGLETATLREIVDVVQETYCGSIGVEFMHIQEPEEKAWIQERMEGGRSRPEFTPTGRRFILERLTVADSFEQFLDKKYTGTKRFGLDGGESALPALEQILKHGGSLGVEEIVLGMPHRGRLNVLANFMGKSYAAMFSEFEGGSANPEDVQGSGDVKYHMGTSSDREVGGVTVHLSLTANPSHLEAVDPVVLGKVRAKQAQRGDAERKKVMGLLMHGDAAFAGQGLVAECFDLSELYSYRTGGTIHFVVNNQIGFTTKPSHSRSGPYCSDLAKAVQAPIFHVNGDDPDAVVHVARVATEYRQKFNKDVVIDMWCYRRHGHNEGDEPAFTQPLMYQAIGEHPRVRDIYSDVLVKDGVLSQDEAEKVVADAYERLEQDFEAAKSYKPNKADWLEGAWSGLQVAAGDARRGETAVEIEQLKTVGSALTRVPETFNIHRKIERQLKAKQKAIESGTGIDWATAEALAFGTLLAEGLPVRLSGQDCGRGTFSQRHAVLTDQESEALYIPMNNIADGQAELEVINSPLSEIGVLGFEYGFSLADPRTLVLWEAQFGDFANGAQIIIDQFIASGESKWLRMSGLVMLLPHGFEGQGPEHSSARLERYLQLCGEDNMQVVNCTTPANYFHVLRRQMHREFRKPLIVMTPKSLLRHKQCVSDLEYFGPGWTFHRVMYDDEVLCPDDEVSRVVLCSGKVYYDLLEERNKRGIKEVFFLRLEQLYPFPYKALTKELSRFKQADFVWCQEEPQNMGAWTFVAPRLEEVLAKIDATIKRPVYVGRPEAASPATGLNKIHVKEQRDLVNEALTL